MALEKIAEVFIPVADNDEGIGPLLGGLAIFAFIGWILFKVIF